MLTHAEIEELIPAFVLNALEPDEMRQVQFHLRSCAQCRHIADEYSVVPEALALSSPQISPPHELRERTLRGLQATQSPQTAPIPEMRQRRVQLTPWLAGAALAVALVALGLGLWQNRDISQQLSSQRDFITLIAYADGPAQEVRATRPESRSTGKLYMDADSSVAALIAVNMPPVEDSRAYQVWLSQPDGVLVSGGTFRVDAEGNGWLLIRAPKPLSAYNGVSVSLETLPGSATPTGQTILQTAFRAQ